MWGANFPDFTYLDMENILHRNGIVVNKTIAATIGGEDDVGRGLSPEGRELIETAIQRCDVTPLAPVNLEDAIEKRVDLYMSYDRVKVFLHIGESSSWSGEYASGSFRPRQVRSGGGLLETMSRRGITVINIMDIPALAADHDLPAAPTPGKIILSASRI